MTHIGPLPESAGTFTSAAVARTWCDRCKHSTSHRLQVWLSNDEAYEDAKYTCLECGRVHWVDGDDG
jgi:RNase P subunit RPR2